MPALVNLDAAHSVVSARCHESNRHDCVVEVVSLRVIASVGVLLDVSDRARRNSLADIGKFSARHNCLVVCADCGLDDFGVSLHAKLLE